MGDDGGLEKKIELKNDYTLKEQRKGRAEIVP